MTSFTLSDLGWSDHFARQLGGASADTAARVTLVHRDRLSVLSPAGALTVLPDGRTSDYAVGDWVLHDGTQVVKRLDRKSLIQRRAAGEVARSQLVAANVDTLGIVTSCNADFNTARLMRYLILAANADVIPLVILTKADLMSDDRNFRQEAEALSPLVTALTLNAKDPQDVDRLTPWCRDGRTLVLVGSSGVGKTTLQNALTGQIAATQGIREDDAKGRHTTTARHLRPTLHGGWLIDTPGMRELGLTDVADGIAEVFADVETLATECKFRDCAHEGEPGCTVQAAIDRGDLDAGRLAEWRKLKREDAVSTQSVADARARDRTRQKMYNEGKKRSRYKREN